MSDTPNTPQSPAPAPLIKERLKKPYSTPTLTECGSVAKLTMAKGTTSSELGQIVKKCL